MDALWSISGHHVATIGWYSFKNTITY